MKDRLAMKDGLAFHREISTTDLSREGRQFTFKASEVECAEIATFLGISALQSLSATLAVRRWRRQGVAVEGVLHAKAVQECVVTLHPVEEEIDEPISLRFELRESRQRAPRAAADNEIFVDPEAADPPELFDGPGLDLGPYLVEFLAMALNPYPRAAGAELTQREFPAQGKGAAGSGEEMKDNPFQILRNLNKDSAK